MKTKINTRELSHLARLSFSDSELSDFERDMESIVSFAKKITKAQISSLSANKEGECVLREDIVKESGISPSDVAPKGSIREEFFTVPRVVE